MSLNDIKLDAVLLENLYAKSLYDLETGNPQPANTTQSTISFLGKNEKKIIIIVQSEDSLYLPEEELNFLMGILTACRLSMADIALVNFSKNDNLKYNHLAEQLQAEKIFLFGLGNDKLELPLEFPPYQVQKFGAQVYVSSASLAALQKDKEEKLKLWNCLKKVFGV
jgi:hypothetical protein